MRPVLVFLVAFLIGCDPGVFATYRVSMAPPETDSISQLSVTVSDSVARRQGMEARRTTDGCSLAYYYRPLAGGANWLDFCVTRANNAVRFSVDEFRTTSWGPSGNDLRQDLLETLTARFGARVSQER